MFRMIHTEGDCLEEARNDNHRPQGPYLSKS